MLEALPNGISQIIKRDGIRSLGNKHASSKTPDDKHLPHLRLTLTAVGTYIIGTEGGTQEKTRQTLTPCCLAKNKIQYVF
jgi:hypothetical protein